MCRLVLTELGTIIFTKNEESNEKEHAQRSIKCYLNHFCDIVRWLLQNYWKFEFESDFGSKIQLLCHCAMRITLSRKVMEFRVFDQLETKSIGLS